jgi:hypothetical protein
MLELSMLAPPPSPQDLHAGAGERTAEAHALLGRRSEMGGAGGTTPYHLDHRFGSSSRADDGLDFCESDLQPCLLINSSRPGRYTRIKIDPRCISIQIGRHADDDEARSDLPRVTEACDGSSTGKLCLHLIAQSGLLKA